MERPVKSFKEYLALLASGVAAGAAIGIGGWSYATLRILEPYGALYGSLAFSLGIILVCVFGLMLYTGKIGYLFRDWLFSRDNEPSTLRERVNGLLAIYVGNIIGALSVGLLAGWLSPQATVQSLASIAVAKSGANIIELFVKSILCGMLVYTGVDLYKTYKGVLGTFLVAICIAAFVLLGFDHCVANAFYWGAGWISGADVKWTFSLTGVLLCAVGNSVGALALDGGKALFGK